MTLRLKLDAMRSATTTSVRTRSAVSVWAQNNVWGRCGFAQELAQRAAFPRRYRMHAGTPTLGPAYMQGPGGEVDVVPAQRHQLRGPEAVAVSDQDSRGVPMSRAVLLGSLDQALDLAIGEIFTAALANCYIY